MIYLDYAASTPVEKEVLDVFNEMTLKYFANPNSGHRLGREAKEAIDVSTKHIAKMLRISSEEIIYTSGATEANNLAIKGVCERYKNRGKHILLSSLEHSSLVMSATAMQENGFTVELIPVGKNGIVDMDSLKAMIRNDTILVSVCTVDSELGIRQPIEEIGTLLKNYPNIIFHTDASQAIGKTTFNFRNVDLITIAPHKFYGLNGFGMLIKKRKVSLKPQINGGKSTTIYRSGTPVVAGVVALDKALELALVNEKERTKYVTKLHDKIISFLKMYDGVIINSQEMSIPYFINFSVKNIKSSEMIEKLEQYDIYVSSKTSCCSLMTPSKHVYALTKDRQRALTSIRLSLSHLLKESEIDTFLEVFDRCYKELLEWKNIKK